MPKSKGGLGWWRPRSRMAAFCWGSASPLLRRGYTPASGSSSSPAVTHLTLNLHLAPENAAQHEIIPATAFKLAGYFTSQSHGLQQNGSNGGPHPQRGDQHPSHTNSSNGLSSLHPDSRGSSGSSTLSMQIPKSKPHRESPNRNVPAGSMEVSSAQAPVSAAHSDPIVAFPT